MALTKCKECGNKISKKAKTCPQCGAPNKKQTSPVTYLVLVVIILIAFVSIGTNNQSGSSGTYNAPAPAPSSASSVTIGATDANKPWSGDSWPFTVSTGTLKCDGDAVIFVANGRNFAVNGMAKSRGFADIAPIWRDNNAIPGMKIYIGVVLDPGLKLCN